MGCIISPLTTYQCENQWSIFSTSFTALPHYSKIAKSSKNFLLSSNMLALRYTLFLHNFFPWLLQHISTATVMIVHFLLTVHILTAKANFRTGLRNLNSFWNILFKITRIILSTSAFKPLVTFQI